MTAPTFPHNGDTSPCGARRPGTSDVRCTDYVGHWTTTHRCQVQDPEAKGGKRTVAIWKDPR